MKQDLIYSDNSKIIYRLSDSRINFYLVIPNNTKLGFAINLNSYDDSSILNMKVDKDYGYIVPVIDINIRNQVMLGNVNFMGGMDKYISECLNLSHKILTHNNIVVDSMVYYVHVDNLEKFEDFFVSRYKERVKVLDVKDSILDNMDAGLLKEEKQDDVVNIPIVEVKNNKGEMGFVSYVLLGVVFAVITLLFLYYML